MEREREREREEKGEEEINWCSASGVKGRTFCSNDRAAEKGGSCRKPPAAGRCREKPKKSMQPGELHRPEDL